MRKITASDALNLSIPERIVLVEDICGSIAAQADFVDITEDDNKIIDERLESYHRNPDTASPWKEVYKRIIKRNAI